MSLALSREVDLVVDYMIIIIFCLIVNPLVRAGTSNESNDDL